MKQYLKFPGWSLSLLALVLSLNATAQFGEGYYSPATNIGQLSHGVGTGTAAFSILTGGSFDGFTNGVSSDNFIGPNGVAGSQEIGGIIAPIFDSLKFNNGINPFYITNTAGVIVNGALVLNNGITSTVRTNRTAGLAGAIQFLSPAIYSPVLSPGAGTDPTFIDGYMSKVNPAAFMYPVGNVTDMRPITVTGTGTFTAAWSNVNVATPYPWSTSNLPIGTSAINTNGYWEWSGSAAANTTVSIPDQTAFAIPSKLSVLAYNGTAWTNLGGVFAANTENSTNASVVSVPASTLALAIGSSVPYVQIKANVFLQGAMSGTAMTTALHSWIPLNHPYNVAAFSNYAGTEVLSTIPAAMTDWVLVDIRDSALATTIIATQACMLRSDGVVLNAAGDSTLTFLNITNKNYYVGIRHRNHLAIRSAALMALNTTPAVIDFRTAASSAYTDPSITTNTAMKDMGNGKFAMWGGNVNGNTTIRFSGAGSDASSLLTLMSGVQSSVLTSVYNNADVNMNGTARFAGSGSDASVLLTIVSGNQALVMKNHL